MAVRWACTIAREDYSLHSGQAFTQAFSRPEPETQDSSLGPLVRSGRTDDLTISKLTLDNFISSQMLFLSLVLFLYVPLPCLTKHNATFCQA